MVNDFQWDVYLSYSTKDKPVVLDLAHRLQNEGLRIWLDDWELNPGDHMRLKIEHGLENSRTVIICMSKAYFESEWTQFERNRVLLNDPINEQRHFIPVRFDDATIAEPLTDFVYIDWRQQSKNEYHKLVAACRPDSVDSPTLDHLEVPILEPESAYFLSLTVYRLRCFGGEPQTLNLSSNGKHARWTLLLGNNGTGKTTLLQVLAILGAGNRKSFLLGSLQSAPLQRITEGNPKVATAVANIQLINAAGEDDAGSLMAHFSDRSHGSSLNITAPICFGYGAARKMGARQLSQTDDRGISASLFDDSVFLRNSEEWLLQLDYSVSKAKPGTPLAKQLKFQLEKVRQILIDLLPDVSDIRFSSVETNVSPKVEFQTPFGWMPLTGIAYGYQSLVAWTVDLASRMVDHYPDSPDPLAEPAVVLIDEIELHLHPSWQRDLLSFLTEKFPNTQFQ